MPDPMFVCPHCRKEIPLTQALSHQIGEKIRAELEADNQKKEEKLQQKEQDLHAKAKALEASRKAIQDELEQKLTAEREKIEKDARKKAEEKVRVDLTDMQNQLAERENQLEESRKKELDLRKQQRELEDRKKALELEIAQKLDEETANIRQQVEQDAQKKQSELQRQVDTLTKKEHDLTQQVQAMESQVADRIKQERAKIEEETRQKAKTEVAMQLKDLTDQLADKAQKLEEAQKQELELRKQRRELEDSKKEFELQMNRTLDDERATIQEEARKKATEEHRLKDLEKEKQLTDLRAQIEDLKRKAEQGSQQTQGEVLELDLEELLKATFPTDKIEPVGKGQPGADITHSVYNDLGQFCGTIIWEAKQTKNWSAGWLEKLKGDQREAKADLAILLTSALPKEVRDFKYLDGIWVTNSACAIGLATALRMHLIQIAGIRQSEVGKHDKMTIIYKYLSGQEFKQRVEAIVMAFQAMQESLTKEKLAIMKIWSQREKQISQVVQNTVGMYGDIQGIIGSSLPQIEAMELKALPAGEGPVEATA